MTRDQQVRLWNAINDYTKACRGDPGKYVMDAVAVVENIISEIERGAVNSVLAEALNSGDGELQAVNIINIGKVDLLPMFFSEAEVREVEEACRTQMVRLQEEHTAAARYSTITGGSLDAEAQRQREKSILRLEAVITRCDLAVHHRVLTSR